MSNPCLNCVPPKRHQGCHVTCPEGLAADEEHKKQKAMLDAIRAERQLGIEYIEESKRRMQKFKALPVKKRKEW